MDFQSRRLRLMLSYLAVIMVVSLMFSGIIYAVTSSRLVGVTPGSDMKITKIVVPDDTLDWLNARDIETKGAIISSLALLNFFVLCAGIVISYISARWTLRPIEDAMESQRQFISDASHELRTPLAALQATNEVVLRKKQIDDKRAREVLGKNIEEVGKLQSLTDTLLMLTVSENPKVQTNKVWLDGVVGDVISTLVNIADRHKITITNKVAHTEVIGDELALGQVITILVDNALKYSKDGSKIELFSRQHKHGVTLEVKDSGSGIDPKDQPYIFDRFYRADAARTRTAVSGHGLGLSIARTLCDKYGMELNLKKSSAKSGSTFSLYIPT